MALARSFRVAVIRAGVIGGRRYIRAGGIKADKVIINFGSHCIINFGLLKEDKKYEKR